VGNLCPVTKWYLSKCRLFRKSVILKHGQETAVSSLPPTTRVTLSTEEYSVLRIEATVVDAPEVALIEIVVKSAAAHSFWD
jgi:hypothetical protein